MKIRQIQKASLRSELGLENLDEVVIDPFYDCKYIVVELSNAKGETKIVLRGSGEIKFHEDILGWLEAQIATTRLGVACIGGGRLKIDRKEKTIRVYDYSERFGREPDRPQTVRMLQAAFPEFLAMVSR
ncbi:MAG: hypothetical protein AAB563_02245 [Patescibacteria group bacterium]